MLVKSLAIVSASLLAEASTNFQIYSIPKTEFNPNVHDVVKNDGDRIHVLSKWNPSSESTLEVTKAQLSEMLKNKDQHQLGASSWFESYHNSTEILNYYDTLVKNTGVKKSSIGKSINKKDYWMYSWENENIKPSVVMTCTVHAREWIAPASCQYFFEQFLTSESFKMLRESVNLFLVPIYNIDGYDYTWENPEGDNRMWRKNRNPNSDVGNCFGVDINRNYDSYWCVEGSSNNTCAETYCGTSAESENETKAITNLLKEKRPYAYFDAHSYSQMLLFPYQSKYDIATTHYDLTKAGESAAAEMFKVNGTVYIPGPGGETIYLHSGGAIDYCYDQLGVKLPFTFELRDTGTYGFILPVDQIIPTAMEYTAGVKKILEFGLETYYPSGTLAIKTSFSMVACLVLVFMNYH